MNFPPEVVILSNSNNLLKQNYKGKITLIHPEDLNLLNNVGDTIFCHLFDYDFINENSLKELIEKLVFFQGMSRAVYSDVEDIYYPSNLKIENFDTPYILVGTDKKVNTVSLHIPKVLFKKWQ